MNKYTGYGGSGGRDGGSMSKNERNNYRTSSSGASMHAVPPPNSLKTDATGKSLYKNNDANRKFGNPFKTSYSTLDAINQFTSSQNLLGKRKICTEDDYFDDDEEPSSNIQEPLYQPAPGSPGVGAATKAINKPINTMGSTNDNDDDSDDDDDDDDNNNNNNNDDDDDDVDPLDAFMAGIEQQVKKETSSTINQVPCTSSTISSANSSSISSNNNNKTTNEIYGNKKIIESEKPAIKGVRTDIDEEDNEESYYRYMEENPNAGLRDDISDQEIDYDEDGNPISTLRKKDIDPLPPIYHSEIEYENFEKNFYEPHDEITALSEAQVYDLRRTLGVKVSGPDPCRPITSFAHFGFPEHLMKAIRRAEYVKPSSIQAQAVPAALSGRDLIGIAKTGSGKTAAFIWPLLVHISDQRELRPGEGPIGLILAPTRELSLQIYNEAKKFGKAFNINVICCYGGGSKWEQSKALEQGAEIVVATPGRIIDLVRMKATNLRRVTFLVLDEADRMFHMGFEPQVRSICNHVRPDRQTLLFSATFKKRIERLARDVLLDPIRIVQGDLNEANEDVTQYVHVFQNPTQKWNWLLSNMVKMLAEGTVLVFVTKKADAEIVLHNLIVQEYNCLLLHGDMDQADRNKVIMQFKRKDADILVATDVAARGLDIPHIRNVVNYDIARDIDTHTHRIGRTGRAGEKGNAHTLITDKEKEFAGHLVRSLEGAGQSVPNELMDLAMRSSWFRSSRFKQGKGKRITTSFTGLGYRESTSTSASSSSSSTLQQQQQYATKQATFDASNITQDKYQMSSSNKPSRADGSSGPVQNRFATMREAFRTQYMSQFCASSDRTWEHTLPASGQFTMPASISAPAKKFTQNEQETSSPSSSSSSSSAAAAAAADAKAKKKKSRWN